MREEFTFYSPFNISNLSHGQNKESKTHIVTFECDDDIIILPIYTYGPQAHFFLSKDFLKTNNHVHIEQMIKSSHHQILSVRSKDVHTLLTLAASTYHHKIVADCVDLFLSMEGKSLLAEHLGGFFMCLAKYRYLQQMKAILEAELFLACTPECLLQEMLEIMDKYCESKTCKEL